MNLYSREIKASRKSLFFWSIGMIALVGSGMAKFATYSGGGQSMNELIAQFPKSIQTIFGLTGFDLNTASGYFGVLFAYIALMATIHAVLLGADIISKEERDRTSEFLFVKPISRFKVISSKLLAGLSNVIVLNLVTLVSSVYFINYFGHGVSMNSDVYVLMAGLFCLQLLFFFIGTVIAASIKRPKTSASLATSVLLVTFILTYLININEHFDGLKYLTPFKYFDAKNIMTDGALDPVYVVLSLGLIIAMVFVTYRAYNRRDLSI